jgi:hypothetical protein
MLLNSVLFKPSHVSLKETMFILGYVVRLLEVAINVFVESDHTSRIVID